MYSFVIADHKGADGLAMWLHRGDVFIILSTSPRPIEAVLLHSHDAVNRALLGNMQCLLSSAC